MNSPFEEDAPDVMGCTDESACNHNVNANIDDDSCTFAETNYDCSGNCIAGEDYEGVCNGNAYLDDCGICNGNNSTCSGCMDEMANNYDPDATIDDGSCTYMALAEPTLPTSYNLDPNFPNPFNPVTKLSFSIPKLGFTTIVVCNLKGTKLATLINEVLNVGNYSISWNASSYPSGVYIFRMKSGEFTHMHKMVLVK